MVVFTNPNTIPRIIGYILKVCENSFYEEQALSLYV